MKRVQKTRSGQGHGHAQGQGVKIGIYGGTFDPIHFGHINLAMELQEHHKLDEIWFCPANKNPHKKTATSASHRFAMLQLAIADIPSFRILDNELKRGNISYTVETLEEIIDHYKNEKPPRQFFLLLGSDSISDFFHWKQPEKIVQLVPVLVGRRTTEKDLSILKGPSKICTALRKGLTPTRIFDISSTEIRKRMAAGLYCGHLVPAKILDYITTHDLY